MVAIKKLKGLSVAILITSGTKEDDKNRWATSNEAFSDAQCLYGRTFKLDVAAEPETAKVERFYVGPEWLERYSLFKDSDGITTGGQWPSSDKKIVGFDALNLDWEQDWWCNPPFDFKADFIEQALTQTFDNGFSGMMFLPHEPLTGWWRSLIEGRANTVYLPDGRYPFYETDGVTLKRGVNFGTAFVLFTPHMNKETRYIPFEQYFSLPDDIRTKKRKRRKY